MPRLAEGVIVRGVDYRMLPPSAHATILSALLATFRKPTPREQISGALALVLGLCGVQPSGVRPEECSPDDLKELDVIFDECADAVLDVLARHGATFAEIGS